MQLVQQKFNLMPSSFHEAQEYAKLIANSTFAPKDFKGKPGDVLVAMQLGHELGLQPIQALQNIAVINGKPSIYGDAMLAVVMAHPDFESIDEQPVVLSSPAKDTDGATCLIKRKGMPIKKVFFSVADAKRAALWGKAGPWTQYPTRMLQMRARSWACRDVFADALKGMWAREEAQDIPEEKTVSGTVVDVSGYSETSQVTPAPFVHVEANVITEAPKEVGPIKPETLETLHDLLIQAGGLTDAQQAWMAKRELTGFATLHETQGKKFIEAFKKRIEDKKMCADFFGEDKESETSPAAGTAVPGEIKTALRGSL